MGCSSSEAGNVQGAEDVPMNFLQTKKTHTVTNTPNGPMFEFPSNPALTVYLDKVISDGIYRFTVQIKYRAQDEGGCDMWMGAAPVTMVSEADGRFGGYYRQGSCGFSFGRTERGTLWTDLVGALYADHIDNHQTEIADDSRVSVEVDFSKRTLSFWVGDKKVPLTITDVEVPLHLGVGGFGKPSATAISFRKLPKPTSGSKGKTYPSDHNPRGP